MNKMLSWWAGDVCILLTRTMWPYRERHSRFFGFGGIFLLLLFVLWAYYVLKGALWLVLMGAIVVANLVQILVGVLVAPFAYLAHREHKDRPRRGHTTDEVVDYYRSQ